MNEYWTKENKEGRKTIEKSKSMLLKWMKVKRLQSKEQAIHPNKLSLQHPAFCKLGPSVGQRLLLFGMAQKIEACNC